jgi:uncharacterized Tic20 family protein
MRTQIRAGLLLFCSMLTPSTVWAMDKSDLQAVNRTSAQ